MRHCQLINLAPNISFCSFTDLQQIFPLNHNAWMGAVATYYCKAMMISEVLHTIGLAETSIGHHQRTYTYLAQTMRHYEKLYLNFTRLSIFQSFRFHTQFKN